MADNVLHLRDALAGIFGATCLVATGAPFDLAKVRMQTMPGAFRSSVDCLLQTVRQDGLLALWRGAGPALASSCIENAVVFTVNAAIHRVWRNSRQSADAITAEDPLSAQSLLSHAVIGGISGVFSATAICPAEVVKCRMQFVRDQAGAAARLQPQYRNGVACFAHIIRTEGMRGAFAGWTPLLLRDVPFNTLFFGSNNAAMQCIQAGRRRWGGAHEQQTTVADVDVIVAGGIAGGVAWTAILPFDAIKSNMQVAAAVQQLSPNAAANARTSALETAKGLWQAGGVRAFYRGLPAALMRAMPANAALFWGVHFANEHLERIGC